MALVGKKGLRRHVILCRGGRRRARSTLWYVRASEFTLVAPEDGGALDQRETPHNIVGGPRSSSKDSIDISAS